MSRLVQINFTARNLEEEEEEEEVEETEEVVEAVVVVVSLFLWCKSSELLPSPVLDLLYTSALCVA